MSGHTPTPWVIWDGGICAPDHKGDGNVICLEPDHRMVASCEAWPANAAFIVLACNSHGELLGCMIDLFENPQFQVAVGGNPNMVDALMDRARAAIAKAKGEAL